MSVVAQIAHEGHAERLECFVTRWPEFCPEADVVNMLIKIERKTLDALGQAAPCEYNAKWHGTAL